MRNQFSVDDVIPENFRNVLERLRHLSNLKYLYNFFQLNRFNYLIPKTLI